MDDLTLLRQLTDDPEFYLDDESKAQLQEIAETKMKDLNAASIDAAISMIAGTARSMGVEVVD